MDEKDLKKMMESQACSCEECDCEDEIELGFPCVLEKPPVYDFKRFQKGVDSYTEMAGSITALANSGVPVKLAFEFLANLEMSKIELKALETQTTAQIEISKNQGIAIEKTQI